MKNYEIIKKYLEHGFWAVCISNKGHNVFSSICEAWIRSSDWRDKIWYAENYVGDICLEQEDIDKMEIISITPIYPPFTPYKVGDLVDVLETVKEFITYKYMADKYKLYPGKKWFEIKNISHSWYWVWPVWEDEWMTLPHYVLAPHIPTTTTETITIGWLQYDVKEVEDRLKDLKPIQK